jgi:hypothetical protein
MTQRGAAATKARQPRISGSDEQEGTQETENRGSGRKTF